LEYESGRWCVVVSRVNRKRSNCSRIAGTGDASCEVQASSRGGWHFAADRRLPSSMPRS
jgi:hypothetical protein